VPGLRSLAVPLHGTRQILWRFVIGPIPAGQRELRFGIATFGGFGELPLQVTRLHTSAAPPEAHFDLLDQVLGIGDKVLPAVKGNTSRPCAAASWVANRNPSSVAGVQAVVSRIVS
jgi:hypothetical protein